ncbi:glycosyltransferase [Brachybacterium sp. AOP25-B2-12]|uniref:glycosyltransferase n=1 Tax=Brachybacterium sp. AOP25-B2-12 TaxID=3457710 RepID=UPI0040344B3E
MTRDGAMPGAREAADPEVSVIICVRDGEAVIGRQLAALDAQVEHPRFEVIVVDNGSRDATSEVVRRWIRAEGHAAASAVLVPGGRAPSIPRARNLGGLRARGRVLAFCDADDEVDPRWVGALARACSDDALVGGRLQAIRPDGSPSPDDFDQGLARTTYLPHVITANCALPRELFLAVGGFDESLPAYGVEDVDFSWRIQEAGHRLVFAPEASVRFHLSGRSASVRKRFRLGMGRILMADRYPAYDARPYGLRLCAGDIATDARALVATSIRRGRVDPATASLLVASLGRAVGRVRYRRGVPRRLLARDASDGSTAARRPGGDAARGTGPSRIAIAANNAEIGGGEVMLLHIARALRSLGISVLVLGPRAEGGIVDAAADEGFAVTALAGPGRRAYLLSLARWRLRHRRIPLWCNGLVPALATTALGPRLMHLHLVPTGSRRPAARLARRGARAVLVPSVFMATEVDGATVLENWTDDLGAPARRGGAARDAGVLRLGFLGRTTVDKGIGVLAEAVARVLEHRPGAVRLVLAGEPRFGDDDDARALARCVELLGDAVDLIGWTSREDFFESIDLAVFPSVFEEPFGLVAAEAMSARVPFVVSDAGALPEVVGPLHPWVARRGDADDLARVIEQAIDAGPEERQAVVDVARRRWEARYSADAGTRRVRDLLATLDGPGGVDGAMRP